MAEQTGIAWADATYNPWWGCSRVSRACDSCFAETFAHRLGLDVWGKGADRRLFGDKHWNEPIKWAGKAHQEGVTRFVFCASMADVFEDHEGLDEQRQRLWRLIATTDTFGPDDEPPPLVWLLLTKRPENILRMIPDVWADGQWPRNVWPGTTVEEQRWVTPRLDALIGVPAPIRFISAEPLMESLNLDDRLGPGGVSWVIAGGESGPKARPVNLDWFRSLRDQCIVGGAEFFMKQMGTAWAAAEGLGRTHGDKPDTWPEDLRIQRRPQPVVAA